jgi:hypothetical protein
MKMTAKAKAEIKPIIPRTQPQEWPGAAECRERMRQAVLRQSEAAASNEGEPDANDISLIADIADVARQKPDERVSCAILLAEIAKGNPEGRPAVAAILAELNELAAGLMEEVTAAVPRWKDFQPLVESEFTEDLEFTVTLGTPEERAEAEEKLAAMAAPPEPEFDFIDNYRKYADRLETPKLVHELLAIAAIAAITNQAKITFEYCGRSTPMDLWIMAIMASGAGKNEALNILTDVLARVGMLDLLTRSSWGSPEACAEQLAVRPTNFFVYPEGAMLLAKLNTPRWGEIKPLITNTYDSNNIPDSIKHRTNSKGTTNTPDITFTAPIRNSFLLMSNRDWLQQQVREGDATGGWLARFLWVTVPDANRAVPRVPPGDAVLEARLKNKLLRIRNLCGRAGEADLNAINTESPNCPYALWYLKGRTRWHRHGPLGETFWARWRGMVLKLAIVFEISRTESLKVSVESFNRAAAWMQAQEAAIFKMLRSEFSSDASRVDKKENFFREAGVNGRTKTEYTNKYRYEDPRKRNADLETLIGSDVIRKTEPRIGPDGKKTTAYVHQDFADSSEIAEPAVATATAAIAGGIA